MSDAFPPGIALPNDFGRGTYNGSGLLKQQYTFWELDSQRAGGNLLIEYGFERTVSSKEQWSAPCYEYTLENGAVVRLWSFGVMYCDGEHGGVFLQTPHFAPRLVAPNHARIPAWQPEHVFAPRAPRLPADSATLVHLIPPLCAWIGAYEQWVLDTVGVDYRHECVRSCSAAVCSPEKLPVEWWSLASKWREYLAA